MVDLQTYATRREAQEAAWQIRRFRHTSRPVVHRFTGRRYKGKYGVKMSRTPLGLPLFLTPTQGAVEEPMFAYVHPNELR